MKILFLFFNLLLIFGLVGCKEDPVQKDLIDYVNNDIKSLGELESDASAAYSANAGDNYTSDAELLVALDNQVIPKYIVFIKRLEELNISTDEVRNLNNIYLNAAKINLEAFNLIKVGIKKQDSNAVTQANSKLSQAILEMENWKRKLNELCKKHNVVLN